MISKRISFPRGDVDLDVEVSADVEVEYGRVILRGIRCDEDLSPAEMAIAEEELVDLALSR